MFKITYTPPPGYNYRDEVQTSDFWGAFWTRIIIGCFVLIAAFFATIFFLLIAKIWEIPAFWETPAPVWTKQRNRPAHFAPASATPTKLPPADEGSLLPPADEGSLL
jgi:hypothetical protein